MLGGQFGAFWGWSGCSGENKNTPFFGVVNLDRYRLVNLSVFSNKPFVCDDFQKDVLQIFSNTAGRKSSLFDFGEPYSFLKGNCKLINWMQDKGFCMLVRATDKFEDYLAFLEPHIDRTQTVLIYSMWKEYIAPDSKHAIKRYLDFVSKFPNVINIHTSGHASADCLAEICNLVNPASGIIPIHSEHSASFHKLPINHDLKSKITTTSRTFNEVNVEIL
jgi:ribonuclease J